MITTALSSRWVWPVSLAIIALIALADYYSGAVVTLSAFYLLPLFMIAWRSTKWQVQLLIVIIVTVWSAANYFSDPAAHTTWILLWNAAVRWLHLTLTAELVRYISELLNKNIALANQDSMTGISNRRAFNSAMLQLLDTPPIGQLIVLVLIDVDYFKQINDSQGHPQGDIILQKVAAVLVQTCQPDEYCGRLGGDEFALVLHGIDLLQLQSRLRTLTLQLQEQATSCSLGACLAQTNAHSATLYELADKALYQTKIRARGTATLYDGQEYLVI